MSNPFQPGAPDYHDWNWCRLVLHSTPSELRKWCEHVRPIVERLPHPSVWHVSAGDLRRAVFQWLAEGPTTFSPTTDPPAGARWG